MRLTVLGKCRVYKQGFYWQKPSAHFKGRILLDMPRPSRELVFLWKPDLGHIPPDSPCQILKTRFSMFRYKLILC